MRVIPYRFRSGMSLFAPAAGSIWRQLESQNLEPGPVFREAGIDPDLIFDANARLSWDAFDRLLLGAARAAADPLFGLRAEAHFRPAHLGALGFAWLASSSLRTALQRMSRYARVINDKLSISLDEDTSNLVVTLTARAPSRSESMREDAQLAILIRCCRAIAGERFSPARVRFKHPEPADSSHFFELFRCPIEFGSTDTSMFIPRDVADKRLTGSNDELARLNEHIVVKYLAHASKTDTVNRAKAAIIDGMASGGVSEAMVAEKLHMTARNLHRKLAMDGTSFKTLLNDVRQELAQQYIADRSLTLTEISFMLGFSEVSSFSRAYKSWTGKSPSAARPTVRKPADDRPAT